MVRRLTTKELFAESLLELVQQKPIEKITIAAIAENCGMTSRTFYNNFLDKYDLINWIHIHQLEEAYAELGVTLTWRELIVRMVNIMNEAKVFYNEAMEHVTGTINFKETSIERGTALLKEYIHTTYPESVNSQELEFIIYMYFHGIAGIISKWLSGDLSIHAEEIANYAVNTMPEHLKPYLL